MILTIFTLLVIFQVKHFICDYPLQTPYMLQKGKLDGWFLPLLNHAAVHAFATFTIVLLFSNVQLAVFLGIADLFIHFIVDRIKASPNIGGRFSPDKPYFWWALGLDQMAHHLTHYAFIYVIVQTLQG